MSLDCIRIYQHFLESPEGGIKASQFYGDFNSEKYTSDSTNSFLYKKCGNGHKIIKSVLLGANIRDP